MRKMAATIRARRAELDLSQAEVAERAGINITTLSKYERAEMVPSAENTYALAKALECGPNSLMGWREAV